MNLSREHQHTLLSIAEWSIQDFMKSRRINTIPEKFIIDEVLKEKLGAFVSVYVKGDLRGCIGTFSESVPLYMNIHEMAIQAAFEDRRFDPVTEKEVLKMEIEISVLSTRRKITTPEEIIIGKHGIYMIHGFRRATLLPQVAMEYSWSPTKFLEVCAKNKLGMTKNSWKESELFVYEAFVFN